MKKHLLKAVMGILLVGCMGMAASRVQATSYVPGYEPYTYVYEVVLDAALDPAFEYLGFVEGYFTSSAWRAVLGSPLLTYGEHAEVYAYYDYLWIVYFNPDGYSTQVLLIPPRIVFGGLF